MEPARTNLTRSRFRWWFIPLAAAVVAAGFFAVRLASQAGAPEPPTLAPAVASATPAPEPQAGTSVQVADESPVGAEGARALLEGVSANPLFRSWLGLKDLVRRWAVVTANVAEGTSPRKFLEPLAPHGKFSVASAGDGLVVAPESYARYDGIAAAIDSIDARALASAYRRLHGAIEAAYVALGYPAGSLDRATARALRRIVETPVPRGEVRVEPAEGLYAYADPALESLGDVEKHLLRLGPRNERLVQAKARELRDALGLPAVAAARR
jgi:hypothetical protein